MTTNINIQFKEGAGHIEAILYRDGNEIEKASANTSGIITLKMAQADDSIAITGVCTGKASIAIGIPTAPSTPVYYTEGRINDNFFIL